MSYLADHRSQRVDPPRATNGRSPGIERPISEAAAEGVRLIGLPPMPFRLHNSLTRRVEDFEPLDPDGRTVTFYSCGPTVYDFAHIGNFRSFLNADHPLD